MELNSRDFNSGIKKYFFTVNFLRNTYSLPFVEGRDAFAE